MSPQAQRPLLLDIVLGIVLPYFRVWAMHRVVLIFFLPNKTPVRYLFIPVLLFQAWKTHRVQDPILRYKEV